MTTKRQPVGRREDLLSEPQRKTSRAAVRHRQEPGPEPPRGQYTFYLDAALVERARREVGEPDVIRSIEAALAAALDYQMWVREVSSGRRDVLA